MRLYYDLASPYAYPAVSRAASVLGAEPEIERRAAACGLPPVRWPPGRPLDSLHAMRGLAGVREAITDPELECGSS